MTGKPAGDDLREGELTTLVAVAFELATGDELERPHLLRGSRRADSTALREFQQLIVDTGG